MTSNKGKNKEKLHHSGLKTGTGIMSFQGHLNDL